MKFGKPQFDKEYMRVLIAMTLQIAEIDASGCYYALQIGEMRSQVELHALELMQTGE
jgi:hypothetical protein